MPTNHDRMLLHVAHVITSLSSGNDFAVYTFIQVILRTFLYLFCVRPFTLHSTPPYFTLALAFYHHASPLPPHPRARCHAPRTISKIHLVIVAAPQPSPPPFPLPACGIPVFIAFRLASAEQKIIDHPSHLCVCVLSPQASTRSFVPSFLHFELTSLDPT